MGTRFDNLSPEERSPLVVGSAEELKNHFHSRASANGEKVVEKIRAAKKRGLSGEQKGSRSGQAGRKKLEREQGEFRSRLAGTDYSIVRFEKKADDRYIVTVRKNYEEESEEVQMEMRLKGGHWLIDSAAALNPAPSKLGSLSAGHTPGAVGSP